MKNVELYAKVRHAVRIEGLSERAAARRFGIDARTVNKMMKFSVPPGYVRKKPPAKPKLDPFIAIIDGILADDKGRPKKQQHTSKRIFERLRDEHGFTGGITIVKDYVAGWRQRAQEMFVPLVHPPGHAQADFGEAIGIIGGIERKIHFFAFDLPHSDACFVVAYPAETTEALRRPRSRVRIFRRRAALDPLRQYQAGGGADSGRRQAPAHAGVHRAAITLPVRGSLRPTWQRQ
jgi:transposase